MQKIRLDIYLAKNSRERSRSEIKRLIDAGDILVNGEPRRPSFLLKGGERIEFRRRTPPRLRGEPPKSGPEPIPLDIIYEDRQILVLNKQAGLVVHPAAGNYSGTLVNALLWHSQTGLTADFHPGLVHRLDKGTSGVMVIAKTEASQRDLMLQFKRREVEKTYLALVFGRMARKEDVISVPIGRDTHQRRKFSSRSRKTREATTFYRVKEEYSGLTLLEVFPKTGRTHQIRVHLSEAGHPIVGDTHYGAKSCLSSVDENIRDRLAGLTRPFLHAFRLSFIHPAEKMKVRFEAPLSTDLEELLEGIRGVHAAGSGVGIRDRILGLGSLSPSER